MTLGGGPSMNRPRASAIEPPSAADRLDDTDLQVPERFDTRELATIPAPPLQPRHSGQFETIPPRCCILAVHQGGRIRLYAAD
jgi:hypothetical protein